MPLKTPDKKQLDLLWCPSSPKFHRLTASSQAFITKKVDSFLLHTRIMHLWHTMKFSKVGLVKQTMVYSYSRAKGVETNNEFVPKNNIEEQDRLFLVNIQNNSNNLKRRLNDFQLQKSVNNMQHDRIQQNEIEKKQKLIKQINILKIFLKKSKIINQLKQKINNLWDQRNELQHQNKWNHIGKGI